MNVFSKVFEALKSNKLEIPCKCEDKKHFKRGICQSCGFSKKEIKDWKFYSRRKRAAKIYTALKRLINIHKKCLRNKI
jgi:predicted Fe-S protein YdhL (DUF1289 family)